MEDKVNFKKIYSIIFIRFYVQTIIFDSLYEINLGFVR